MTSGDNQHDPDAAHEPSDALAAPGPHGAHLTPDLPPAAEAPELRGAVRPRPEDSPAGRQAELPPPYGPLAASAAAAAKTDRKGA